MGETAEDRDQSTYDLERLVVFSDGVFAIVITLLVLPLTAEVDIPPTDDLAGEIFAMWPRVVTFLVSFLVVGQFWMVHHRVYSRFTGCTGGLIRISLLSLLTVCFLPFPAALLGEHTTAGDQFPVVFYATCLTLTSVSFTATWLYAKSHGLVDPGLDAALTREMTTRSLVTSGVFVLSIGAAFFGLVAAVLCWMVLLPLVRNAVVRMQRTRAVPA
ncbi:MAG: TMEM175 family protein [Nocardioidaceae bacterium]